MDYKQRYLRLIENVKNSPHDSYDFAVKVARERVPELEESIKKDLYSCVHYAIEIFHDRWPDAEDFIFQHNYYYDSHSDYLRFCRHVLREQQIAWINDPRYNIEYTLLILNDTHMTLKLQELIIKKRPDLISKIKNLGLTLQRKYRHELALDGIEI